MCNVDLGRVSSFSGGRKGWPGPRPGVSVVEEGVGGNSVLCIDVKTYRGRGRRTWIVVVERGTWNVERGRRLGQPYTLEGETMDGSTAR